MPSWRIGPRPRPTSSLDEAHLRRLLAAVLQPDATDVFEPVVVTMDDAQIAGAVASAVCASPPARFTLTIAMDDGADDPRPDVVV